MQVATVKTADNKERYMLLIVMVNQLMLLTDISNTKTAMVQQEIRLKHTAII